MAADVAKSPVRLVKTIGDAAMLVANEPEPLDRRDDRSRARAPTTPARASRSCARAWRYGPALGRAGDWYGRSVNVASRVTGVARPGSVLVTAEAKDKAEDAFKWSFAGRRKLKNVKGEQPLFRARLLDSE